MGLRKDLAHHLRNGGYIVSDARTLGSIPGETEEYVWLS